jgi:DNA-binding transcriptional LysR family regulator
MIGRRLDALEARLGVKLLQRTTRKLALTDEGAAFLEDCQRILAELEEAESAVSERSAHATGHLMISAPAGFGRQHVAPLLPSFLAEHRDVTVTLNMSDRVVDIVGEGIDVAIRIASLSDSSLVSVKLADNERVVVARPPTSSATAAGNAGRSGQAQLPGHQQRRQPARLDLPRGRQERGVEGERQYGLQRRPGAARVGAGRQGAGVALDVGSGQRDRGRQAANRAGRLFGAGQRYLRRVAQRRHLPLRIRAFVDFLRHSYAQPDYWRKAK